MIAIISLIIFMILIVAGRPAVGAGPGEAGGGRRPQDGGETSAECYRRRPTENVAAQLVPPHLEVAAQPFSPAFRR